MARARRIRAAGASYKDGLRRLDFLMETYAYRVHLDYREVAVEAGEVDDDAPRTGALARSVR